MKSLPASFTTYTTTWTRFQVLLRTLNGPACPFLNKVPQQRGERHTFTWWKARLLVKLSEAIQEIVKKIEEYGVEPNETIDRDQARVVLWYCFGELVRDIVKMMRQELTKAEEKQQEARPWRLSDFFFHLVRSDLSLCEDIRALLVKREDLKTKYFIEQVGDRVMKVAVDEYFLIPAKRLLKNFLILVPLLAPLRTLSKGIWSEIVKSNWALYIARCASYFSLIIDNKAFLARLETECKRVAQTWPKRNCARGEISTVLPTPEVLYESTTAKLHSTVAQSLSRVNSSSLGPRRERIYGF